MANFLDKAIAAISPEKGYRRAMARTALSIINNGTGYGNYGASHTSRSMRSWHVGGGSAKEDIEDNLETLRKRSRDAYMGIPLATGAIKTLRTNVVGSGLVPTPQVDADYKKAETDQRISAAVDAHNGAENAHSDIRASVAAMNASIKAIELKFGTNVTKNPFSATFGSLDGLTVTGAWNAEQARVEF